MSMTKTERTELKSIVKRRFKVLRSEVDERATELAAEVDHAMVDRFEVEDHKRHELQSLAVRRVQDVHAELEEAFREQGYQWQPHALRLGRLQWQDDKRALLRRAALADIESKAKSAKIRLEREEVDLLQTLAIGALETEEAQQFLAAIPTVGELVPAARLAEIEQSLEQS